MAKWILGNPRPGHTKGGAAGSNSIPLAVAKSIFGTRGKTTQAPPKTGRS